MIFRAHSSQGRKHENVLIALAVLLRNRSSRPVAHEVKVNRTRFSWTRTWVNDPKGGGQERWGRRKGPSEARAGVMVRG